LKSLKIGIVCYPTYGGSGVVATELGIGLAKKGHKVHFITYKQPFRLDNFHPNVSYHEVSFENYALFENPPYETALSSRIVDVVKHEKLDILHVHYAIPHASAAYMAQQILKADGIFIPFITTLHGTDITLVGKDHSFLPVVNFSINNSNGISAVSESLKAETLSNFQIQKEIKVIPNFIDFQRFSKKERNHFRKLVANDDEKILIHISNFRKVKRVEDVARMFELVLKKIPAKLLMVGDGPERHKAEELTRSLGVCAHVKFIGKQEAVEDLLSISDLFVLPSQTESFGLAALEAMACEVPVISSNSGGIPEINIQGKTGFLSPVGDYEDMAKNAIYILENEERMLEFKKNAFEKAQEFHIDKILPMYENFYYEMTTINYL
jgi:N-acetyl-alpha-D-glucosaminyl L-malate synthase BshA